MRSTMISNIDSNYNSICRLFNFSEESSAEINKRTLLKIAESGEEKPKNNTKLGIALRNYLNQSAGTYDPIFAKNIKNLRPDWFITRSETANENKKILLEMAINGKDRPSKETKLGNSLCNYICKYSGSYDEVFDKKIRKLSPDWFVTQEQIANQKKRQLIKMAKSRKSKPHWNTEAGRALVNYAHKKNICYCPKFDKEIRKLAPNWFLNQKHFADQKKKLLIKIAKNGEDRPNQKNHELGGSLCGYTNKSSETYDPKFDKEIRKLAPNWFISKSQIADQKKKLLIGMAKSGEDRPNQKKTDLGRFLVSYTNKHSSSYCSKFDKEIRKLSPNWFISKSQIADQKKKLLIKIAKSGKNRPGQNTTDVGKSLTSYTCKTSGSYDAIFDKKIRKLRPDWFGKIRRHVKL